MKLYQLTNDYKHLEHLLTTEEADEESLSLALNDIKQEILCKCTCISGAIKNSEALTDKMKEAENSIKERRQRIEKKIEFLKGYVLTNMEATGITKISDPYYDITIRKSSRVEIDLNANLPKEYLRETLIVEPDKKSLRKALERGLNIDGVRLEPTKSLVIK